MSNRGDGAVVERVFTQVPVARTEIRAGKKNKVAFVQFLEIYHNGTGVVLTFSDESGNEIVVPVSDSGPTAVVNVGRPDIGTDGDKFDSGESLGYTLTATGAPTVLYLRVVTDYYSGVS